MFSDAQGGCHRPGAGVDRGCYAKFRQAKHTTLRSKRSENPFWRNTTLEKKSAGEMLLSHKTVGWQCCRRSVLFAGTASLQEGLNSWVFLFSSSAGPWVLSVWLHNTRGGGQLNLLTGDYKGHVPLPPLAAFWLPRNWKSRPSALDQEF
jgi:hypothetical protein